MSGVAKGVEEKEQSWKTLRDFLSFLCTRCDQSTKER